MGRPKAKINPKAGERIKLLLKERDMTQRELAAQSGLSEQLVSGIISNRRGLTEEVAKLIAETFKPIDHEWILGISENRTNAERIISGMNQRVDRYKKVVDLIELSGYTISKEIEDEIKFYVGLHHAPDFDLILSTPNGARQRCKFTDLIHVIEEIDEYITFKLSRAFKG